ncbi:MAG: helix-turn-helix domain-containing protein [Nitrospiraceae bacterium]
MIILQLEGNQCHTSQPERQRSCSRPFAREINRSEESRYHHRLHVLLLVAGGRSCTEVGRLFGHEATTVPRWVEQDGFIGLREGDRPGWPMSLDKRQWTRLARDLHRDPRRLRHAQHL